MGRFLRTAYKGTHYDNPIRRPPRSRKGHSSSKARKPPQRGSQKNSAPQVRPASKSTCCTHRRCCSQNHSAPQSRGSSARNRRNPRCGKK